MMKYNLIITYEDDREDVYQLGDGFYTLGSGHAKNCGETMKTMMSCLRCS